MLSLIPWLEIEAAAEEMTDLREGRRFRCWSVRVDARDDERPRACSSVAVATDGVLW